MMGRCEGKTKKEWGVETLSEKRAFAESSVDDRCV